jgi:hypothetical protein
MIQIKVSPVLCAYEGLMWKPISSAPFECDVELSVWEGGQQHALIFPCRQFLGGWMDAKTKRRVEVHPTHWRFWI